MFKSLQRTDYPSLTKNNVHSLAPSQIFDLSSHVEFWRDVLFRTLTFFVGMLLVQGGWIGVGGTEISVTSDSIMNRNQAICFTIIVPIVWIVFAHTIYTVLRKLHTFEALDNIEYDEVMTLGASKVKYNLDTSITRISVDYVMKRVYVLAFLGAITAIYTGTDNYIFRSLGWTAVEVEDEVFEPTRAPK